MTYIIYIVVFVGIPLLMGKCMAFGMGTDEDQR